jgi:ABC-type phosphate transport system auxiliary subunit
MDLSQFEKEVIEFHSDLEEKAGMLYALAKDFIESQKLVETLNKEKVETLMIVESKEKIIYELKAKTRNIMEENMEVVSKLKEQLVKEKERLAQEENKGTTLQEELNAMKSKLDLCYTLAFTSVPLVWSWCSFCHYIYNILSSTPS